MNSTTSPLRTWVLAAALAALAAPARGEERPREEDLFGSPPAQEPKPEPEAGAPAGRKPEEAVFGEPAAARGEQPGRPRAEERLLERLGATDNPLQIGGQLYLRANASARRGDPPSRWGFDWPSLLDVFLDARPSERVRAYVLARAFYDPAREGEAAPLVAPVGVGSVAGGAATRVALDQLWLSFDLGRRAFVTVGKQHVKWGTGRVWNPTDFLHVLRRDPLAVFDDRGGTAMARLRLPLGEERASLTAAAVVEPLARPPRPLFPVPGEQRPPASELGALGGAVRAEALLGTWEVGADAVAQRGMRPRFGLDVSGPLWELDLRGEMALRTGSDVPVLRPGPEEVTLGLPAGPAAVTLPYRRFEPEGVWIQAVAAVEWSYRYSDEDSFTLGAEYFHNGMGYSDEAVYPWLLGWNAFTPFYLGRHYAAAFLFLPRPGSWNDTTVTLTGLANLSDRSGVVRLDWATTFLTFLRVEAYVQAHLGREGGEFRFAVDVPPVPGLLPEGLRVRPPVADVGLALRVAL